MKHVDQQNFFMSYLSYIITMISMDESITRMK